jgi:hypothetical protein
LTLSQVPTFPSPSLFLYQFYPLLFSPFPSSSFPVFQFTLLPIYPLPIYPLPILPTLNFPLLVWPFCSLCPFSWILLLTRYCYMVLCCNFVL